LDHAILQRKADIARDGARELNDRNLWHWLRVLRDQETAGADDVPV
jgi:hypothetical protein